MKKLPSIVALLLGVAFIYFGVNYWINPPKAPEGSFIGLMNTSGYLALIKVLEIVGGALLIFPRTRAWGLILIGAILFNIVCVHQFFFGGLKDWKVISLVVAGLYLAWVGRKGFCCLACCGSGECLGTCGCCNQGGSCGTDEKKSGGCCGN